MIISEAKNYFNQELNISLKNTNINPVTIMYLAHVLEKFISVDSFQKDKKPPYLALIMKDISETKIESKKQQLILNLGENALFISSFMPSLIYKRNVNLGYYLAVGSSAYSSLSSQKNNIDQKNIFKDVSLNFKSIVNGVSSLNKNQNSTDTLTLMESWQETENSHYLLELIKRGIIPSLNQA